MAELYVSWVKGLPQNKEALGILKESGWKVCSGINLNPHNDVVIHCIKH